MVHDLKNYLLLLLLCLCLYLPGLFTIPPIDRDEARFAQATSQMLESGDFVQIRFQEEPRNKKPIGIYWLQAASVALSGTLEKREIWPYRIPSLLGAILSVLFLYAIGKRFLGVNAGLLGAAFCASTILLVFEAHNATTDAALLPTILAAQGALGRLYLRDDREKPDTAAFLVFWIAQAAGILIKGPITPLISLLTIGWLVAWDRKLRWLKGLRPLWGLALTAAIASPWAIAIGLATKGAFFQQSLGGDLLSKVAAGQESHGFVPGYYLLLAFVTLWPASFVAIPALSASWKSRSVPAIRFCLAWIIPAWVLFELVPTKLPHYILPVYPALCLLAAKTVLEALPSPAPGFRSWVSRFYCASCFAVPVVLGIGALAFPAVFDKRFEPLALLPAAISIGVAVFGARAYLSGRLARATVTAIVGSVLLLAPLLQWILPGVDGLWLSRTVANGARERAQGKVMLASSPYHEPSLVFLLGTQTLTTSPGRSALFLKQHPEGMALIGAAEDNLFKSEALRLGLPVHVVGSFRGFRYSGGRYMSLRLYTVDSESGSKGD
ncbi:MAG: glycosyltransferase family 39 protein [Desulfobacteraceae bacterium]|nr:glycosyltransferase family 39 protein [Desulfobacteraceae bacterium]